MYKIVKSENHKFTLSFLANWKLNPMNLLKGPPRPTHTHTSDVSIFKGGRGGFHAQYRGNVLLWPKSDVSKKAWSSSTCLLYGFLFQMLEICKLGQEIRVASENAKLP
jgi:hypothetical protein